MPPSASNSQGRRYGEINTVTSDEPHSSCCSITSAASRSSSRRTLSKASERQHPCLRRSRSMVSATTLEAESVLNCAHQTVECYDFDPYGKHRLLNNLDQGQVEPASTKPFERNQQPLSGWDRSKQSLFPCQCSFDEGQISEKTSWIGGKQTTETEGGASSADCEAGLHQSSPVEAGKFRYLVAAIIIVSLCMCTYANNTLYIVAIDMISNDVYQNELTVLRAKHITNDPLAMNVNAALPGTCPIEASPEQVQFARAHQSSMLKGMNASQLSAIEHELLLNDTKLLEQQISKRVAAGQLVDWSIDQRGYIFTAHTIGTILLAMPIGRLGLVYGSYRIVLLCLVVSAVRMLAFSSVASCAPFWATFFFEIAFGGMGANLNVLAFPVFAAWMLPDEANFCAAFTMVNLMLSIASTNFISTRLLALGLAWSWCYYLPGFILSLLAVAWLVWGADRPEKSRFVSRAELELLQNNSIADRHESALKETVAKQANACADEQEKLLAPPLFECQCPEDDEQRSSCLARSKVYKPNWLVIFTCPTMWAIIFVQFANGWTTKNATLYPTYFSNIHHLDSSSIGIIIGIKGIWTFIFGLSLALATRKLSTNPPFNISLTAYRRSTQSISVAIFALSIFLMVLLDCDMLANFLSLLLQPIVASFNSISHEQMPLDLSAEGCGMLLAVVRTFAIGDIIALPFSSFILSYAPNSLAGDRLTWRLVWLFGLAVRLVAGLYFVLVAKSEPKNYSRFEAAGACRTLKRRREANEMTSSRGRYV